MTEEATDRRLRSPPPPPRLSGDYATDTLAIGHWMHDFYSVTVVQSGLIDPSFQFTAGTFDPSSLPDPGSASIATAQQTANEAYTRAVKAPFLYTEFTLDEANNEITFTFDEPLADADYRVVVQAVGFTGTPSASAFVVTKVVRTVDDFVVTIAAAPGGGNSVSFECVLFPKG